MRNGHQPTKGKRVTKAPTNTPKGGSAGTKDYKTTVPKAKCGYSLPCDVAVPPPDEEIIINHYGLVMMNKMTLIKILTDLEKAKKEKILEYLGVWKFGECTNQTEHDNEDE